MLPLQGYLRKEADHPQPGRRFPGIGVQAAKAHPSEAGVTQVSLLPSESHAAGSIPACAGYGTIPRMGSRSLRLTRISRRTIRRVNLSGSSRGPRRRPSRVLLSGGTGNPCPLCGRSPSHRRYPTKKPRPCAGSHGGAFATVMARPSRVGHHLIAILDKPFQVVNRQADLVFAFSCRVR